MGSDGSVRGNGPGRGVGIMAGQIVGASGGHMTNGQMQTSGSSTMRHEMAGLEMSQQQHSVSTGSSGSTAGSTSGTAAVGGGGTSMSRQTVGALAGHSTARQLHSRGWALVVHTMDARELSQQQQVFKLLTSCGAAEAMPAQPRRTPARRGRERMAG